MASSYLPRSDASFLAWSGSFLAYITANTAAVGLSPEQVTAYTTAQETYGATYATVQSEATRSPGNVYAKNQAREALTVLTRQLVNIIQAYPGTTDQMRVDMNITVRDTNPTPKPVPATAPLIQIRSVDAWTVKFRLQDAESTSRAKPAGVSGAAVFSYVGTTPPVDVAAWKFEGNVTRTSTDVTFPSDLTPGTTIWLTATWYNTTAETGPAAIPVSTKINWGGMNMPQSA